MIQLESMKSFKFSIKIYVKETRIIPFSIPRNGMYQCNWSTAGIYTFNGIENGFDELRERLDEYFYLDQSGALIEYYDRKFESLMEICCQSDFESALKHSSQTYSPFSLVLKVNAERKDDHWTNEVKMVNFIKTWQMAKPKFGCIREWLVGLEKRGEVRNDVMDTCTYYEKAVLYSQFNQKKGTNHNKLPSELNQSNVPENFLTLIKDQRAELLKKDEKKMLNEKMMMDPVISMILFNEYIPLRQRQNDNTITNSASASDSVGETVSETEKLNEEFDGLFLGNRNQSDNLDLKSESCCSDFITMTATNASTKTDDLIVSNAVTGLFIRSQYNESDGKESSSSRSSGLFIRSEETETEGANAGDDWIIA